MNNRSSQLSTKAFATLVLFFITTHFSVAQLAMFDSLSIMPTSTAIQQIKRAAIVADSLQFSAIEIAYYTMNENDSTIYLNRCKKVADLLNQYGNKNHLKILINPNFYMVGPHQDTNTGHVSFHIICGKVD